MHPSLPGWKSCSFRYRDSITKLLVLASLGQPIRARLPLGFPTTGPESAMEWAFSSTPGSPPNIIFFVGAILGLT